MKLVTFSDGGAPRIGSVLGDELVDFSQAAPGLPTEMVPFLEAGDTALVEARRAEATGHRRPLVEVRLLAPILRPPEYIIAGVNYSDHIAEARDGEGVTPQDLDAVLDNPTNKPEIPIVTNKQSSCVVGPGGDVHMPRMSSQLDYEAELAFVIGKRARHLRRADAAGFIAGYLVANDVSVRDWQFKSPTHTLGKSFDTHGPIGPWIVTPDEVGDPHSLDIRCWINDELRQSSNTRYMIFDCFEIVEALSTVFTLLPGTIISTGTPAGVGVAMNPPVFLKVGDRMRVEIDRIGSLENSVVDEPA